MMKLVSFDMDDTLFNTPLPLEGKVIWKEKTGTDFPHEGWWGKKESLDINVFDIKPNAFAHKEYLKHIEDENTVTFLATGRLDSKKVSLRKEVETILEANDITFNGGVHLNTGGDTFDFKRKLFERLIVKFNPDEFIMYDDREEHIERFIEWAKEQKCSVSIYDVRRMRCTSIKKLK